MNKWELTINKFGDVANTNVSLNGNLICGVSKLGLFTDVSKGTILQLEFYISDGVNELSLVTDETAEPLIVHINADSTSGKIIEQKI